MTVETLMEKLKEYDKNAEIAIFSIGKDGRTAFDLVECIMQMKGSRSSIPGYVMLSSQTDSEMREQCKSNISKSILGRF